MSRALAAALGALGLALAAGGAGAQVYRYMAFGDSITLADPLYDDSNPYLGGYPGRLETRLGCTPTTCEVVNEGKGAEQTSGGVTRIQNLLAAERWDLVMLMEGTNDVFKQPPVSNTTIRANLDAMGNFAKIFGVDALHASIIWFHPDGTRGTSRDAQVEALRDLLEDLSVLRDRYFADPWSVLCADGPDPHGHTQQQCFNLHYFSGVPDPDPVGHPNATGFDMMTDAFFGAINAVPAPGAATPVSPTGVITDDTPTLIWTRESPERANWYQLQLVGPLGPMLDKWVQRLGTCIGSDCFFTIFPAVPEGDYQWRVRTRNPRGYGPWSPYLPFTIQTTLIFSDGFESGDTSAWSAAIP